MTLKESAKWTINEERVRLSDDTFEEVFWSHIRSVAGFAIVSAGAVAFPFVPNLLALPFLLAALWWLPPTAGAYYHWRESSQEAGEV